MQEEEMGKGGIDAEEQGGEGGQECQDNLHIFVFGSIVSPRANNLKLWTLINFLISKTISALMCTRPTWIAFFQ